MDEFAYYRAFFESFTEGMLLVDENSRYLAANPAFIREYHALYLLYVQGEEGSDSTAAQIARLFNRVILSRQPLTEVMNINGKDAMLSFSPLNDGTVIRGAIALFRPLAPLSKIAARYKKYSLSMESYLKELYVANYTLSSIVGTSAAITKVKQVAEQIAATEISVLLIGENGTGKELFASAIHQLSNRKDNAFVAINCPSITDNLLESELFGYEKGAFTGAAQSGKLGLCEIANGGTLFLDEVGDLSMTNQVKLLRFIESGSFLRVGGLTPVEVDVRIIAATNKDLVHMAAAGQFRQDLFYRLAHITLEIPPLRDRAEDISTLAKYFIADNSSSVRIAPEALRQMETYLWPGNVRELKNTVTSMMGVIDGDTIDVINLPEHIRGTSSESSEPSFTPTSVSGRALCAREQWECQQIKELLQKYGSSVKGKRLVAQEMGISLSTLYNKIRYYFYK